MAGGGLYDPLGTDRAEPARPTPRLSAPVVAAGLAVAAVAVLLATAWLRDDGDRGEPRAVSAIAHAPPPPPAAPPPVAAPPAIAATGLPAPHDDQEVEIQNGVRIIRPRRDRPAPSAQTLAVPDAAPASPAVPH